MIESKTTAEAKSLIINNSIKVEFEFEIKKILNFENSIIVLLKIPHEIIYNDNIFCVNPSGKIVWQFYDEYNQDDQKNECTNIVKEDDSLVAFNWDGDKMIIDKENGKILSRILMK